METWLIGLAGSAVVGGAAYWKGSLSRSGFAAAVGLGTVMYGLGSLMWFGTLLAFFLSCTLLSRWKRVRKTEAENMYEKSGRRDAGQVAANGGLGLLLAVLYSFHPHPAWAAAFVGCMAAVNADTWATEIGALSRQKPRSIVGWKPVPPGTSGGVTLLGTAAAAAGGLFIGFSAWLLDSLDRTGLFREAAGSLQAEAAAASTAPLPLIAFLALGLLGGLAGSMADSVIGAKWQQMYRCPVCGKEVERPAHCGQPARRLRGGLGNDGVNGLASLAGAVAAVLLWLLAGIG